MVNEMHIKTLLGNSADRLINDPTRQHTQALKRKLLLDKFNCSKLFSRPNNVQFNQFVGNLASLSSIIKNNSSVVKLEQQHIKKVESSFISKSNCLENGPKLSKPASEGQKSKATCRNQGNKPSATTTLWNMDICNMLGISDEEEVAKTETVPPREIKQVHSTNIKEELTLFKQENIRMESENSKIKVELARGNRFGAYETLVARLRERGRSEFLKGGPGCSNSCRDTIKTNPIEEIANQRLHGLKYADIYYGLIEVLRRNLVGSVSTSVLLFDDESLVPPHEEDDCTEERLAIVSYGDAKFPAIRRDGDVFVRLADINNEAIPSKDTRSLQSKCKRLAIPLLSCTDTELNLLINFANSPQTKSHHIISLDDTQKLLDSLLVDRRRRKTR